MIIFKIMIFFDRKQTGRNGQHCFVVSTLYDFQVLIFNFRLLHLSDNRKILHNASQLLVSKNSIVKFGVFQIHNSFLAGFQYKKMFLKYQAKRQATMFSYLSWLFEKHNHTQFAVCGFEIELSVIKTFQRKLVVSTFFFVRRGYAYYCQIQVRFSSGLNNKFYIYYLIICTTTIVKSQRPFPTMYQMSCDGRERYKV